MPRRKGEPLYEGDIYIIADSWRIYGVNLQLTKESSINMLDTLHIRQEFIPFGSGQWQPSSIRFNFVGGLLGFRVGGYFAAVYREYRLNPPLRKGLFNEVLRIAEGANEEEQLDYIRKDSLQRRHESSEYLGSLDRVFNRLTPRYLPDTRAAIVHSVRTSHLTD